MSCAVIYISHRKEEEVQMNRAKLTSLLLILCMAGSGAAAQLSSFTAYAAEEETVITEDMNE